MRIHHSESEACCGACGAGAEFEKSGRPPDPRGDPVRVTLSADGVPVSLAVLVPDDREPGSLKVIPVDKPRLVIGRGKHTDILLNSGKVSREQCVLYCEGGSVFVEDLGSGCGTWLNRQRIKKIALHEKDVIFIADFQLRVTTFGV